MTPEQLAEFATALGYEITVTTEREDIDVTTFGETRRMYMASTTYSATINRHIGRIVLDGTVKAHSWVEMEQKLIHLMTT